MNKINKSLLTALFLANTSLICTQTNKTFLAGRPVGVNLAMEGTTWHTQINLPEGNEDKFGAIIQVVGFYQENTNKNDLGKYFGFGDLRSLYVGAPELSAVDIDKKHLLHRIQGSTSTEFTGTINLSYKHEAAGMRIDYQQDLDGLLKGLFFKIRTPIVWEEMKLDLGLSGAISATINQGSLITSQTQDVTISNYFDGTLSQSAGSGTIAENGIGSRKQASLSHGKIAGNHSKGCLADIDLLVGWNFWETKDHHAGINIGVTIPTGPNPDGVFTGEAQCGNRGHWGLGAGLDFKAKIWKGEHQSLALDVVGDWRYLFEDDEKRTLGLVGQNWGQYFLLGEASQTGVFPAANILTQIVDVRPGNQVDFRAGLAYQYKGLTADLGYNLYTRESERVKTKSTLAADTYGIAGNDYDCATAFSATGNDIAASTVTIAQTQAKTGIATPFLSQSDIDVVPAETPDMITHKVYGGVGYAWNDWDSPVMIGAGGAYEFASDQKALEEWSIWGKVGVRF